MSVDEAGTLYLATYNSASGTPSANGAGGWTGTTLETFSSAVTTGANSISFTETAASATATHFAFYVRDAAGNDSAVTTQAYTHDLTGPALTSSTPADGSTDVAVGTNIALVFDETVAAGSGNFYLYNGATLLETITVAGATISTNTVTLNPLADFANEAAINVRWDAGVVTDQRGNGVAANTGATLLNFTVIAAVAPGTWDITDNADGSMTITASEANGAAPSLTDNTDGSMTIDV